MIQVGIWEEEEFGVDKEGIRKAVINTLESHNASGNVQVDVNIVGEKTITDLNEKYLKHKGVTDVLSFPLEEANGPDGFNHLGDIVVCWPVAKTQGEAERLTEHGCLHLLGIHHKE